VSYNVLRYAPLAVANRLWKWLANSPSLCRTVLGTVLEEFSVKQSSPFMEMVVKQFSPFMELLVQLCLTACATMSYYLCNCVLLLVQLCLTACATMSYYLCNYVLLLVQLCLTTCATVSYYLCKWLASSPPIYGNGFRSSTSENQRLHKELSNSEIGLHTNLGNSRTEKALLKQELMELRSQLETERADWKETEAELFELKQNSAPVATVSDKLTPDAATILSQLARQAQKSKTDLADLEVILEILQS
jgi:hypothetical protein